MATYPNNPPFYGRGIEFPFQVDPATGAIRLAEGTTEAGPVMLEFIGDSGTISDPIPENHNLIKGAVAHILNTRPTEHDTLPEFGSSLDWMLFDPNTIERDDAVSHYFCNATERWERRLVIDEPDGVEISASPEQIDRGDSSVVLRPHFIPTQVEGNLVAPFVTPREARLAEYPSAEVDEAGHDYESRYFSDEIYETNGIRHLRVKIRRTDMTPRSDDIFHTVAPAGATWLLISWEVYGDIRHWPWISEYYAYDAAQRGEGRDSMDNTGDPEPNAVLRMPSRTRVLMELAG